MAHAATSMYWALGGTALLDTIGGDLERWGREREASAVIALLGIGVLKAIVAVAAPIAATRSRRLPHWTSGRLPRILSWTAAVTLVVYGALFTTGALLALSGLAETGADADRRALAWHGYFWDPWFLLWGSAFIVSLWLSRQARSATLASSVPPAFTSTNASG